jgi:hypothetical protein
MNYSKPKKFFMTNRIEFELEITGLKLKVKGAKDSANLITSQVSDTLRGLISPPTTETSNGNSKSPHVEDAESTVLNSENHSPRKRGRKAKAQNNSSSGSLALDFRHEPEKYGNPSVKWSTATKSLWLLYVVKDILKIDGMSSGQIKETFNKHFRQAKLINAPNVSRDLGKLKVETNSIVGEDTSKSPYIWYLTDEGIKHVQKSIAEQKSQGNGSN